MGLKKNLQKQNLFQQFYPNFDTIMEQIQLGKFKELRLNFDDSKPILLIIFGVSGDFIQ
jgi:hypothetical protein